MTTGNAISHSNCSSIHWWWESWIVLPGIWCPWGSWMHAGGTSHMFTSVVVASPPRAFVNSLTHILQDMRVLDLSNNKLDGSECMWPVGQEQQLWSFWVWIITPLMWRELPQCHDTCNTSLMHDDSVGEEGVRQLINSLKHNQTERTVAAEKLKEVMAEFIGLIA